MINYTSEERFQRYVGHGSLGMTNKYFMDGYWYKQDNKGYEGKSEAVCSMMLGCSNVEHFVDYEECIINGVSGCRSKNFLKENETLVTLSKLYSLFHGGDLRHKVNTYDKLKDRIEYVLDFVNETTGLDLYNYLGIMLKFDMLTYDVDRHFNNLAVIKTADGYKEAPLFDFGASFFSMQHIFTDEMTLEQKIAKMTPQPFAASFEEQAAYFERAELKIDYTAVKLEIIYQPEDLQDIVMYNMNKYKDIFMKRENL